VHPVFERNETRKSSLPAMSIRAMIHALGLLATGIAPAFAETTDRALAFTVVFRGLAVAEISGTARETDAAYAAAVRIRSTGLAAAFARVRFDMAVEGFLEDDALRPFRYRETVDTGQRSGRVELLWPDGAGPVLLSDPPPVEAGVSAVSADDAAGASDRLTLLWRLARPQPGDALCNVQAMLFDGARLASVAVGSPRIDNGAAACSGAYTRLGGFPEAELAGNARFPFEITYRERPDGLWELTGATGATIYGRVRILTRN
jgi:hypothetical protein